MPVPATVCAQDAELSPVFFSARLRPSWNERDERTEIRGASPDPGLRRDPRPARPARQQLLPPDATLREVRARGWAFDDEEDLPNIRCVAAPVRDMRGQVVAAISAVGTVLDISRERIAELAATLCATANEISQHLGHPAADGRAAAGR